MDNPSSIDSTLLLPVLPCTPSSDSYNCLVIAGGATKCIAVLGALHYLQLTNIKNYAGTSAGGILSYFLAIGYTPFEIMHFICSSNFIDEFQNLNIAGVVEKKGLINYYIIQDYLEKLTLNKIGYLPTFKDISTKMGVHLTVVSYNLTKNQVEYLNVDTQPDMPCLTALRMTSNVPLLFERFFYNNCEYLDGGLVDNFPIDLFSDSLKYKPLGIDIISVDTSVDTSISRENNYIIYLLRVAMIPYNFFHAQKSYPSNSTVIQINPGLKSFDFNLSISKRLNLFSAGYQTAKSFFNPPKGQEEEENETEAEANESVESVESAETTESVESAEESKDEDIIQTEEVILKVKLD